jgi:hypothetical protein
MTLLRVIFFINKNRVFDIYRKNYVMNIELFKNPDPTGKMSRENFVLKNYPDEYDYIIRYSIENNFISFSFKEKVYLCVNNIKSIPLCKNVNCNNKVKYKNSTLGYNNYCCNKCISSDPNIKKIKEEKSYKKFGTKSPSQSKLIKDKIIKTNNEKYGGNSPMSDIKIQVKSKETLMKNYGVINPCDDINIMNKKIESFKKSNYKISFEKTSFERYGVKHPWMNKEIHDKTIDFFYQSYKSRILEKIKNSNYIFSKFEYKPTSLVFSCPNCKDNFNITSCQFYYRIDNTPNQLCTKCYPISINSSLMQLDLVNFIKENYSGEIIENGKLLHPYEVDIFLPKLNLAIEFNGIYWHSDEFKPNDYHLKKWQKSIENNINLITIWEDDWIIKKDICKSFLLNKLNKIKNRIFARKCIIEEIKNVDSKIFLENNHLQGNSTSSIRLALYYNEELVSLMTFGKLRLPLSGKNNFGDYELIRFVNKINTNVIGGASKLLNFFIKKFNPNSIISYSDNHISSGKLYEKLGFEFSHISNPGYWYIINKKREHRFNWRKSVLVKMGYDENKTEHEIMSELGYNKIYNAGNKKWILKR